MAEEGSRVPAETVATSRSAADGSSQKNPEDVLVQYIVVRKDLSKNLSWPAGSVIAQACHAAVGIIFEHAEDPIVRQYCSGSVNDNIARDMHKVVVGAKDEKELMKLSVALSEASILHKVWIEQPENFPTCLATKPYPRKAIAQFFKKLNLYR